MKNLDQLQRLAENAGFQTYLDFDGDQFDVCVAAISQSQGFSKPFNVHQSQSTRTYENNVRRLRQAALSLSENGLMFVYGTPALLARYAVGLADSLSFRYWIALRAATESRPESLRSEHQGLLLFSKASAPINRLRIEHSQCRACGQSLKDWGGKAHLMNPGGVALSDVWMDLVIDSAQAMPAEIFTRILQLSAHPKRDRLLILGLNETLSAAGTYQNIPLFPFNPLSWMKREAKIPRRLPAELVNRLHEGKCLEVLKTIPSQTIDLAFADPPFNLTKAYNGYRDEKPTGDYLGWCKRWLIEYERVLKPGGALMILNLPRWSIYLADFLSRSKELYLQNWIVWNALPEPKGLLMPAHYSLLYFTKGSVPARFNYCSMEDGWQPFDEAVFPPDRADVCKRRASVRKRRTSASTWRGELTDIWHDIPRDRRVGRRSVLIEGHPCPTPEALIDRAIRLTTVAGDVVLDAFAGVGTTALVAGRLGRNFIAIEQDARYTTAAEKRIEACQHPLPQSLPRQRRGVTKRKLQLELKRLTMLLNRLPTRADVEQFSEYRLEQFEQRFESWSEALKAAKTVNPVIDDLTGQWLIDQKGRPLLVDSQK
jgi:site-specific DNA-methyltransferase (adenine-specific)